MTSYVSLDKNQIKALSQRSNIRGAWLTFHVWAVIVLAGSLFVIWPNPLTFLIAIVIIGARQHGMAILMHDAAHSILFKDKKLNDFVGKWFLAAPYGGDLFAYRKYHLIHHRHTQTDKDPDLPLSAKFPVTKQSLIRKFLRDITGVTFLRLRIATYKLSKGKEVSLKGTEAFEKTSALPFFTSNAVLFAGLALSGLWWAYPLLWLLPLWTVFFAVLRLRNIAEHAMTERSDNPLTHARTTHAGWFARTVFAPYWVNYHVEHHAYMYVPCYNLPKLHSLFRNNGYVENMEYKENYRSVLKSVLVPA